MKSNGQSNINYVEREVAVLSSGNVRERRKAAERLYILRWTPANDVQRANLAIATKDWGTLRELGAEALEPLVYALHHKESWPWSRRHIVLALGDTGSPIAANELVKFLGKDTLLQPHLFEALSKLANVAIPPLVEVLCHKDLQVRQAALKLLEKFRWEPTDETQRVLHAVACKDWRQVINLGTPAVQLLLMEFETGRMGYNKLKVAQVLVEIGDARAIRPLMAWMADRLCRCREEVAKLIGKFGKEAIGPLVAYLNYKKTDVRSSAATDVRRCAAIALGEIGDPQAVEPLVAALAWDLKNQSFLLEALAQLLGSAATELFVPGLRHANYVVRRTAAGRLEKLRWCPTNNDERAWWAVARQEWKLASQLGSSAIEPLVNALRNNSVRFFAAKALLGLGKAAVERLIELAPGIQDNRLLDIFRILGDIGDPRAVPYLIRAAKQSEYRGVAICALGKIGDVRAIPMLLNAVQDEHVVMIQEFTYQRSCENAAVWALGAIGDPQVVPALIDMIQNPKQWNVTDKNLVIEALGEIRDPRGLPIVITALEDCYSHHNPSGYSKIPAIEALAKIGGPSSVTALLKALQCEHDKSNDSRYDVIEYRAIRAIMRALEELPDHRAIRGIIESIRKEMSAWQAVQVLQSLLMKYPERLQTEDLEEVIGLKAKQAWHCEYVYHGPQFSDGGHGKWTWELCNVPLDLSQVKQVARQELFRRVRH